MEKVQTLNQLTGWTHIDSFRIWKEVETSLGVLQLGTAERVSTLGDKRVTAIQDFESLNGSLKIIGELCIGTVGGHCGSSNFAAKFSNFDWDLFLKGDEL